MGPGLATEPRPVAREVVHQDVAAQSVHSPDASDRRQLELMTRVATLPAPNDDAKRTKLAGLASEMESIYGKGKFCADPSKPDSSAWSATSPTLTSSTDDRSP